MINLFDLPHFEYGKYLVFIDNIMGHTSWIIVMTKDRSPLFNDGSPLSTCRAGFITLHYDSTTRTDVPKFSWNSCVEELPELPFDQNVLLEKYKQSRKAAFGE